MRRLTMSQLELIVFVGRRVIKSNRSNAIIVRTGALGRVDRHVAVECDYCFGL